MQQHVYDSRNHSCRARRAKQEISAAGGLVFAGAPRACNVLLRGGVSALTVVYPSERRRADGGPAPQISLAIQEVLPHPAGLSGGGVPDTLGGRWQALQRGVQRKRERPLPPLLPTPCRVGAEGGGLHRYSGLRAQSAAAIKKVMLGSEARLGSPED